MPPARRSLDADVALAPEKRKSFRSKVKFAFIETKILLCFLPSSNFSHFISFVRRALHFPACLHRSEPIFRVSGILFNKIPRNKRKILQLARKKSLPKSYVITRKRHRRAEGTRIARCDDKAIGCTEEKRNARGPGYE